MRNIELKTEQDTIDLAAYIAPLLKPGDIVCLYGDLGSGKTFFTKALGKQLFIEDEIDSPSFVLFKEYHTGKFPLYHLDLYRLKNEGELLDLGIFDMLETGITVIEWPALAERLLPYRTLDLHFCFNGRLRKVEVCAHGEIEQFFLAEE
ncbi:MAG: tRNA (adenosine(37)-N6)-threonylcarbamoyltransferase complex ATPase subunit type 1 TsaE [Candidatus Cloacimonetes bacterium HGW-Cloacimonetes-2]|jgi:tRNA threonylcarbamoyl adenosine modification protein YjeE|nr:MAG: tRNA (adenosine(37)-N6)-threonylcarbamoyltransferase complex ATPase subunit type 1 TsaE [Candidatus Cloacimonetes bacterium HGW-Cloacimonetes-2]